MGGDTVGPHGLTGLGQLLTLLASARIAYKRTAAGARTGSAPRMPTQTSLPQEMSAMGLAPSGSVGVPPFAAGAIVAKG